MNQDRIKDRILRKASRMWGYNELESETSFDPIVALLLSACASELEKLDSDLDGSRSRIIERVLEIMFPEEVSGVQPARSILQVFPTENNVKISLYNQFKAVKKINNIYNPTEVIHKDVFFGPTLEAKLTTAKVEYLAHGSSLKKMESYFYSDVMSKSDKHIPPGELWIGLRCPNQENLEDLMFYIDINNNYQKDLFFYYLKQVKVYFGEQEFSLKEGYNTDDDHFDLENIITKNYSNLDQIYASVNHFYFSNFFSLQDSLIHGEKPAEQELFTHYFINNKLQEDHEILWLKFKFSETIVDEILENISISLNCIPVVNKRYMQLFHRLSGALNIVPIASEDHFLDLESVSNDKGKRFDLKTYDDNSEKSGSVTLRKGGVSRFDQRSASELLQYLLELVKDETASFAGIGGDTAKDILKQINQNVAGLHQLAKEKQFVQANNPYLMINSFTQEESGFSCGISFWTTLADEANDLKTGTVLIVGDTGTVSLDKNAIMITPSVGGRKSLSSQDKVLEYRNALLTRGRVVTISDIKAFGLNHFKSTITNIEVKKGTKKENSVKEGFSRTIDIYLKKNPEMKETLKDSEWKYLCDSFLLNLKRVSSNVYPYELIES